MTISEKHSQMRRWVAQTNDKMLKEKYYRDITAAYFRVILEVGERNYNFNIMKLDK